MSTRRKIIDEFQIRKKSRLFIPPMLKTRLYHESKDSHLIDVSLYESDKFVLTFDNVDYEPLKMDIYRLQNHSSFCDIDFGDDNKEINLLMKVPEEFKTDFDKYLEGKYSKFSKHYKVLLTNKYNDERKQGFNDRNGLPNLSVFDVIYPNEDCREKLAQALSIGSSIVKFDENADIELIDAPNREVEDFKTVEELKIIYGIK